MHASAKYVTLQMGHILLRKGDELPGNRKNYINHYYTSCFYSNHVVTIEALYWQ